MYETAILEEKFFRVFQGAYNDFRLRARSDYKFEIDPLVYDDFIDSFKNNLINCIILLEDSIPTGFLAYTTVPDDVIELFIIPIFYHFCNIVYPIFHNIHIHCI